MKCAPLTLCPMAKLTWQTAEWGGKQWLDIECVHRRVCACMPSPELTEEVAAMSTNTHKAGILNWKENRGTMLKIMVTEEVD